MDMTFAFISDEVGDFFAPDAEIVQIEAPKLPDLPPECWNDRPIDAQRCWDATRAMCR